MFLLSFRNLCVHILVWKMKFWRRIIRWYKSKRSIIFLIEGWRGIIESHLQIIPSIFFRVIHYSPLHFVRYSLFFNANHKTLWGWLRSVENTEDINAFFDGLFVSHFSSCLKKSWRPFYMNSPVFNSRRNVTRPPKFGKKSSQVAGFSDVFTKNFAQSFYPLDKHNPGAQLSEKNFSSKLLNFPRGTFVIIEL